MIKHYCDKCGKEIHGIVRGANDGEIYRIKITFPGFAFADTDYEFCHGCVNNVLGENIVRKMDEKIAEAKKRQQERNAARIGSVPERSKTEAEEDEDIG